MLFDRIAVERHAYTATRAERLQNAKHWILRLDADGPQKPLRQRPEFVDASKRASSTATRICLEMQDAHLAETQQSLRPHTSRTTTASTTRSAIRRRRKLRFLCRSKNWMAVPQGATGKPAGSIFIFNFAVANFPMANELELMAAYIICTTRNIVQPATCTWCAELGPTALLLLSHHALLVFALSCRAQVRGLSQARRHVWDRADKQVLAFPSATFCSTLWCSLMTRSWWFLLLDTYLSSCSPILFVVLSVLRARSHHRVSFLKLDAFPGETESSRWAQVESPRIWHALSTHAPNCSQHPLCRTCSCSAEQFCQHRRTFCPPLAIVPAQTSLWESNARRCARLKKFFCGLLRSDSGLWLAAMDTIAYKASNGGVLAFRSGRSSLWNFHEMVRDLICTYRTHFVSTGVTWCCGMASRSSTFFEAGHPLTTHLCSAVCSQARNAHHALGSSHTDCSVIFVRLERICHLVLHMSHPFVVASPAVSPRAHHLPHSLFLPPRHKNTQHNRYNTIHSENTQYIMHISKLSQSTSSAIKNHSGVKTCRVAETRARQLPHLL